MESGTQSKSGENRGEEVLARSSRRRSSKEFCLAILKEVVGCKKPGEIGAILHREGLYSFFLHALRLKRKKSALAVKQAKRVAPYSPRMPMTDNSHTTNVKTGACTANSSTPSPSSTSSTIAVAVYSIS